MRRSRRRAARLGWPASTLLAGLALAVTGVFGRLLGATEGESDTRRLYREMALGIQQHTWRVLAFAAGAEDCASAPYVTYRRDTRNVAISDHWYVALQLRADAALVRLGHDDLRCQVDKTVTWMERLWDPVTHGYAPRADLDGGNLTLRDVYADDNALIGLAFVEAARVTLDPAVKARALLGAERAAAYLLASGLWDDTFGGGLWWNTQRDTVPEGKPAQTTALLAHLLAELHAETGRAEYRDGTLTALSWLDRVLWDAHHGLYAYAINRPGGGSGGAQEAGEVTPRYFGYDQAIVIQALVRLHRGDPEGSGGYLARAQALGRALDRELWHPELGGYTLEAGGADIYAPYAAWVSEALLDLYAVDGDPFWRERSRLNLDVLHKTFAKPEGGYSMRTFPCTAETQLWCLPGERWGFDRVTYTMTQALMQRAAALQAAAY